MIEKSLLENGRLFRRVNTNELDVGTVAKPVKKSWIDRSSSSSLLAGNALVDVKVVNQLFAIVAAFSLTRIMIADGRIDWHSVDYITIRLVVSEVPIVVLAAGIAAEAQKIGVVAINVVASRQDQPDIEFVNSLFQRLRDLPLSSLCVLLIPTPKSPMTAKVNGVVDGFVGSGCVRKRF